MAGRGEPSLNGCNDLLIIPGGNGCLMCMSLMEVQMELSTTESPWSFQ
jgi:hypothetical protein